MSNMNNIIKTSFTQYGAAVLQSRALVDVRDCLKPSARQIFFCMDKYKYTANKPFQPTAAAMGDAMKHFYIHGDSSCVGIIMRAGQSFAMRYPLVDVRGNAGTLLSSGNWAAERYTKARLSKLAAYLFEDIDKETIDEWRDNYADNEQYPSVLPTKGFYNLVNGTSGIGIGMACSVPQYNIVELNKAMIHLIDNPDCDFEDIYCAPDFATGAILYNENDVKESMKNGTGFACKLRSVVEFDSKERCFVVTEIPYGVYTNTICGQLEEIVNGEDNPGIERFNDLTGSTPLIKIYLSKNANPDKVLKYLFKNTFLQYHYGINFTMLENGRFPRVFTWKEMLQSHIDHERVVYRRGFEFDLRKIEQRLHIINGLLICLASIDEVVKTIKSSSSTASARVALCDKFLLDEAQAKAVLDMKLSKLAHLEVEKLENEKTELEKEANRIKNILENEELFKEEIKRGWREVAEKFGDPRRTQILNLNTNDKDEVIEEKTLLLNLTDRSNLFISESSTMYSQKRGGVGTKFKLDKNEQVIDSCVVKNTDNLLFFSRKGNYYNLPAREIPINEKVYLGTLLNFGVEEDILTVIPAENKQNIVFITRNGYVKKSNLEEYNTKRKGGVKALTLEDDDRICTILFTDTDNIGLLTGNGNFLIFDSSLVNPVGRIARGVKGIKLDDGDYVCSASVISSKARELCFITQNGISKRVDIKEFSCAGRYTKGSKIQKLKTSEDRLVDFVVVEDKKDVIIVSAKARIVVNLSEIPLLTKSAAGTKTMKLGEEKIIGFSNF